MAGQDLRAGAVKLHPVATDFPNLGMTLIGLAPSLGGLSLDETYVAVLTNQRGRIIWDCSTAVPHLGTAHGSTSDALDCAYGELKRRSSGV